ncbi:hypothetical protein Tco_0499109 [Tanacetum coccineum]
MPGYESDAFEAASHSLEYAPPADDDMEPTEAPLSHDYSADSEPIEDGPQEAGLEDDPEEGPSEEEIPSPPLPSSPTHRNSIPKVDLPHRNRARLSSPPSRFEIRERSAPAAARQPGSTLAQGAIDRLEVALEETDERLADLGTHYRQDSHEIYVRLQDAQDDKAVLRAQLASFV